MFFFLARKGAGGEGGGGVQRPTSIQSSPCLCNKSMPVSGATATSSLATLRSWGKNTVSPPRQPSDSEVRYNSRVHVVLVETGPWLVSTVMLFESSSFGLGCGSVHISTTDQSDFERRRGGGGGTYNAHQRTVPACIDRCVCWATVPLPRHPCVTSQPCLLFAPHGSPTHHSDRYASPSRTSRSPVSAHSRSAKPWSVTWKRSLTRAASPRRGRPGVVVRGSARRKET